MKNNTKTVMRLLTAILYPIAIILLTGCGSIVKVADFPVTYVSEAPADTITSYEKHYSTLKVVEAPTYVKERTLPDKTLYNPMGFAAIDGFSKMNILVSNSYFTYDLLTKSDWGALDRLTEATNVNITLYDDAKRTTARILESGFIYKIDEDYMYIGTAGHCATDKKRLKNARVMFFDRKTFNVDLSDSVIGGKFNSKEGDYAMFRIPTSSIPYEELLKLKEVCYSKEAIKNVYTGDILYTGNIYAKGTSKDYDRKLPVINESDPAYKYHVKYDSWKVITYDAYYVSNANCKKGQSGSAVFDKYGNAVACVSGGGSNKSNGITYTLGVYTKLSKLDFLYDKLKN